MMKISAHWEKNQSAGDIRKFYGIMEIYAL
jgi:hypothetical protein